MKDTLEALLANLKRNYDMACEAQRYAGEDYYHVQSIVVGLREDIAALTAIIAALAVETAAPARG